MSHAVDFREKILLRNQKKRVFQAGQLKKLFLFILLLIIFFFYRYAGPTLVEVIDNFKCPERPIDKPFRFSVNDIFKNVGSGFSVSGHMETGMVSVGDKVVVLPRNESAVVKGTNSNFLRQDYLK